MRKFDIADRTSSVTQLAADIVEYSVAFSSALDPSRPGLSEPVRAAAVVQLQEMQRHFERVCAQVGKVVNHATVDNVVKERRANRIALAQARRRLREEREDLAYS